MNLYQFLEKETAAGQTPSEHLTTINTKLLLNGRIGLKPRPGQHPGQLRPPPPAPLVVEVNGSQARHQSAGLDSLLILVPPAELPGTPFSSISLVSV